MNLECFQAVESISGVKNNFGARNVALSDLRTPRSKPSLLLDHPVGWVQSRRKMYILGWGGSRREAPRTRVGWSLWWREVPWRGRVGPFWVLTRAQKPIFSPAALSFDTSRPTPACENENYSACGATTSRLTLLCHTRSHKPTVCGRPPSIGTNTRVKNKISSPATTSHVLPFISPT